MSTRFVTGSAVILSAVLSAGCGRTEPAPADTAAPAETAAPAQADTTGAPRAFFVQPQDGATVTSPVMLEFGAEGVTIAAVPPGTVSDTRPGMGHYHVAVDAECLPAGAEIPKAAPWVHFGDGKNTIEMQLPPGRHTLTLQVGDDLHRTVSGLCSTISVDVTE